MSYLEEDSTRSASYARIVAELAAINPDNVEAAIIAVLKTDGNGTAAQLGDEERIEQLLTMQEEQFEATKRKQELEAHPQSDFLPDDTCGQKQACIAAGECLGQRLAAENPRVAHLVSLLRAMGFTQDDFRVPGAG